MAVTTLIVAILVMVLLFYVIGFIPDATLKKVAWAILVVMCLLWVIRNIDALLRCCRV